MRRRPSVTRTAPPRPHARSRWPRRPKTSRQMRHSGKPQATGCAKSSRSGGPSAGWTARPTMPCGSGTRRPAKPSIAAASRDLLTEWRAAGRAAKDVDETLWQRFKAAQDTFFSARNAASAERDAEFHANADAKEALLAEAEKVDTSDPEAARAALRTIDDKWDAIGKVPRERSAELERRLRAVEKKVRDTPSGGVDPEAKARADQFRARAEQFERQAEKAAAAGRTKDAEEARANAEQWRQWADAAAEALGK